MSNFRIIARLDIKGPNLIKGIHLEGLRIIGAPNDHAIRYYQDGIDELIYMDSVASLYGRKYLGEIIESASKDIFIPITAGGGIRSIEDAREVLRCGADKVAINTAAIHHPKLIHEIANEFGSQSVVCSIEAKKTSDRNWEAYTNNGRDRTHLDVLEWATTCENLGAGEILLTSVDREGTRKGFDVDLVKAVSAIVDVPIIASGGMGKLADIVSVGGYGGANAVAIADALHYQRFTVSQIRNNAREAGFNVR
jgi:imidazole glycerol-phosphate synthase subunit HisF